MRLLISFSHPSFPRSETRELLSLAVSETVEQLRGRVTYAVEFDFNDATCRDLIVSAASDRAGFEVEPVKRLRDHPLAPGQLC